MGPASAPNPDEGSSFRRRCHSTATPSGTRGQVASRASPQENGRSSSHVPRAKKSLVWNQRKQYMPKLAATVGMSPRLETLPQLPDRQIRPGVEPGHRDPRITPRGEPTPSPQQHQGGSQPRNPQADHPRRMCAVPLAREGRGHSAKARAPAAAPLSQAVGACNSYRQACCKVGAAACPHTVGPELGRRGRTVPSKADPSAPPAQCFGQPEGVWR